MIDDADITDRHREPRLDVAVDGQFAGTLTADLRHELMGWVVLPLAALALAGLMALLIALLRIPGAEAVLPWNSQEFFQRGLIAHVTMAFVVWYLGVHGALTVLVTAKDLKQSGLQLAGWGVVLGRAGVYLAALGMVCLAIPAIANLGEPSPNNYIPVLVHPLYYAGLCTLALGLTLPIVRLLALIRTHRTVEPLTFGVAAAGVIFLVALVCFAAAYGLRPANADIGTINEFIMWGGGHVLQFANTALFLCAAYVLTRITLGETPVGARAFKVAMMLLVAGSAVGPLLYLTFDAGDPAQREMFTNLFWFVLPLPTAVVVLGLAALLLRRRRDFREGAPELTAVAVALGLFAYGGVLGFFESSVDTRTPGHYHAELIAVTLAFMALYFALFLPVLERRTERRRLRTWMYVLLGAGQFLHSSALYLAGFFGVARKVAGAEQGLDSWPKIASMAMMGVGGVIAVAGGVIFIVLSARLLLRRGGAGAKASAATQLKAAE
ncbi:MAG: cbb3-type cytochrome c oxidase subunit I [Rhodospirillaceae bacterium]|nr:cbb3-type cytochrome c oxidase subunit I [Rhodospirillaceae bacterium]